MQEPNIKSAPLSDFSEDKCDLEPFADSLTHLITSHLPSLTNESSKVIALDSGWGNGKTSFINMWTNKIKQDDMSITCLIYNAWENDDSPNALIPILCSLQQLVSGKQNSDKFQEIQTSLKDIITRCAFPKIQIGTPSYGMLPSFGAEWDLGKISNQIFEEFNARQKNKELFEKLIKKILEKNEDKTLLICVDELDRCRPTFAIETLEVVKHFFDIPNVVFVFALDMKQLCKSIQAIYGQIDSMMYLQKFFDYTISLPKTTLERFLGGMSLFPVEVNWLNKLSERFSIPLRTLNVICMVYFQFKNYSTRGMQTAKEVASYCTYLLFIALKLSNPLKYQALIRNGIDTQNNPEDKKLLNELQVMLDLTIIEYTNEIASSTLASLQGDTADYFRTGRESTSDYYDIPLYMLIDNNIEKCCGYGCGE